MQLRFAQANRAVSGVDIEQASTPVQLSVNGVIIVLAFDSDGDIQGDMAVASMDQKVGGKFIRNIQDNASITRAQAPTLADG